MSTADLVPEGAKKTDLEYLEEIIKDMAGGWIPLKLYCSLFGETQQAIYVRISKKWWQLGVHYAKPKGGGIWVCMPAVKVWVEAGGEPVEGGEDGAAVDQAG